MRVERESSQPDSRDDRQNMCCTAGPVLDVILTSQGSSDNLPHADRGTRSDAEVAR